MLNKVREAVSADRNRFKDSDFNLDLSYVTPRIIAMALPSGGLASAYRNHHEDVDAFLKRYHDTNFMIWNLSEFTYDAKFNDKVIHLPFPDHHPPPLELLFKLVEMMDNWLRADDKHVAVVHCKGGKGRTGTIIVSLLFFRGDCLSIDDAQKKFAVARSSTGKGVTQPSQRRYIQYFKTVILEDRLINYQPIRLLSVTVSPLISSKSFMLQVFDGVTDNSKLLYSKMQDPKTTDGLSYKTTFEINTDVRGDLYFKFFRGVNKEKVERAFHIVLHTYFIASTKFVLSRKDLDHLKSSDKRFSADLSVSFEFGIPTSTEVFPEIDSLHLRMRQKFTSKDNPSTDPTRKSMYYSAPNASKPRRAGRNFRTFRMAYGELHLSDSAKIPVYDHPLIHHNVKLGTSTSMEDLPTRASSLEQSGFEPSTPSSSSPSLTRATTICTDTTKAADYSTTATTILGSPPTSTTVASIKTPVTTLGQLRRSRKDIVASTIAGSEQKTKDEASQSNSKSWASASPSQQARQLTAHLVDRHSLIPSDVSSSTEKSSSAEVVISPDDSGSSDTDSDDYDVDESETVEIKDDEWSVVPAVSSYVSSLRSPRERSNATAFSWNYPPVPLMNTFPESESMRKSRSEENLTLLPEGQ